MTQSSSSDVDTTISVYLRSKLNPDALNKLLIFQKKKCVGDLRKDVPSCSYSASRRQVVTHIYREYVLRSNML